MLLFRSASSACQDGQFGARGVCLIFPWALMTKAEIAHLIIGCK